MLYIYTRKNLLVVIKNGLEPEHLEKITCQLYRHMMMMMMMMISATIPIGCVSNLLTTELRIQTQMLDTASNGDYSS